MVSHCSHNSTLCMSFFFSPFCRCRNGNVFFLHSAHNFFEPGQPHECLLTAHRVICRVFFFDSVRGVHFLAPCIFVVVDAGSVYNFWDILPYVLKITCMGREVVCNYAQYLLGSTHMQQTECIHIPGRGSGCFATFRLSK